MSLPFTKQDIAVSEAPLSMMSCAVCIVEEEFHMFSVVRRCVVGTMRCNDHHMQCANCKQEVDTDAQLLCFACSDSGQGAVFHEKLSQKLSQEKAEKPEKPEKPEKCCLNIFINTDWGCGCSKCMENTAQFYVTRAIEEGYASSLSPSLSPKSFA